MHDARQWLLVTAALLIGVAGTRALDWIAPSSDQAEVCGRVLERLTSLDETLLRDRDRASSGMDDAMRSPASLTTAAPRRVAARTFAPTPEEGDLSRVLERLEAGMEELRDASLCRSPEALAAEEDAAKLESARNRGAVEDAHRIVEYALDRGIWSEDDARSLREAFAWMTQSQRDELLNRLIPALQSGLEVESFPPL